MILKTNEVRAAVILDVEEYNKEANTHLINKKNYKSFNKFLQKATKNLVNNTIKDFQSSNTFKEKVADALLTHEAKKPHYCFQPKTHKKGKPELLDSYFY